MINPTEVINLLHINGVSNDASAETVRSTLKLLGYNDIDTEALLGLLKGQGWFPNESIAPITAGELATTINMKAPPPQAPSSQKDATPFITETVYVPTKEVKKIHLSTIILLLILLALIAGLGYVVMNDINVVAEIKKWYQVLLLKIAERV